MMSGSTVPCGTDRAEIVAVRNAASGSGTEYYVHYVDFDRRLDTWVHESFLLPADDSICAAVLSGESVHLPQSQVSLSSPTGLSGIVGVALGSTTSSAPDTPSAVLCLQGGCGGGGGCQQQQQQQQQQPCFAASAPGAACVASVPSSVTSPGSVKMLSLSELASPVAAVPPPALLKSPPAALDRLRSQLASPTAALPMLRTRNMKRRFGDTGPLLPVGSDDAELLRLEKEREEATKVKNIARIVLGRYEIETWYFSPYPLSAAHLDRLYICEYCLKYMEKETVFRTHRQRCPWRHPPGKEIYRKDGLSVWELDGNSPVKLYCQNLCLLAKLFLDHKTLYFDVEPFYMYVLTENDADGCHIVGYFSKEKYSLDEYNIACILVLPPYQRKGYGRFLIACAYALTRRENKFGTPERPLSDLGYVSFRSYWSEVILSHVHRLQRRGVLLATLTVRDIALATGIKPEDIVNTLAALNLVKFVRGEHVIILPPSAVEEQLAIIRRKQKPGMLTFDDSALLWAPPPSEAKKAKSVPPFC